MALKKTSASNENAKLERRLCEVIPSVERGVSALASAQAPFIYADAVTPPGLVRKAWCRSP
jgi:hypothetical protein